MKSDHLFEYKEVSQPGWIVGVHGIENLIIVRRLLLNKPLSCTGESGSMFS